MGLAGGDAKLYEKLRLWELADQVVFEPTDSHASQFLSVSREDGELRWIGQIPPSSAGQSPKTTTIFGLAGIVKLLAGTYALVITGRKQIGKCHGADVFLVTSMKVLGCNNASVKLSTSQEKKDEAQFKSLLKAMEKTSGLYYSYETDMTLSSQRAYKMADRRSGHPLWKRADPRFLWNRHLLEELIENKMEPYILPIVQGSFHQMEVTAAGKPLFVTLISRRSTRRIGTRMWRRGADLEGHVANFVESEQILEADGFLSSHVQIRGSIPILWEQIVDLTYKPPMKAVKPNETPKVMERHFRDLRQQYGSVLVIDLVNQHGSEASLSEAFGGAMQSVISESIRYVAFDFHKVCGNVHFELLSRLYEQIEDTHLQYGYFSVDSSGKVVREQTGVVRTNCVDCLDRTNVTQSLLGRKALESQLQHIGIFERSDSVKQVPGFDEHFKILWADHGDDISIQYSGTQALKGDFVRYGKRTYRGLLQDGFNALARYYYNNFTDGIRQDAMDLIVGHYTVSRSNPSPFALSSFDAMMYLPLASALIVTGATLTTMSLRLAGGSVYQLLFSVLWAAGTAGVAALVRINGRQFCSRPRLCKLF